MIHDSVIRHNSIGPPTTHLARTPAQHPPTIHPPPTHLRTHHATTQQT